MKRASGPDEAVPSKQSCPCPLQFNSSSQLFQSLIHPLSIEQFFQEYWEKQPLHLRGEGGAVEHYYGSLFPLSGLKQLCAEEDLHYYSDINVVRCVNGKKKVLNKAGKVKYEVLNKTIVQNKGTVQFHQPQRFTDELWHIQEKLESFFGGLVGSNVYITPPASQGLPAHYDDVEVFILQLEGQKHWRLYNPTVLLSADYSLVPEDIIGTPTHDIILKPGDLLYFPRGTIHQANTPPGEDHSTHLTLSTYQRMSWGDLLLDTLPGLVGESSRAHVNLRCGMPLRFLLGGCEDVDTRTQLSSLLRQLAHRLDTDTQHMSSVHMKRDFISNRLPPFCTQEQLAPVGRVPTLEDTVCLRFKDHMLITVEPHQRTTDEAPEQVVFVLHSLKNHRDTHMMSERADEEEEEEEQDNVSGLQFPLSHLQALHQLQKEEHLPVTQLHLCKPEDQLSLVVALWSESLLRVL